MVKVLNNVYKKVVDTFYRDNVYSIYTFSFIIISILVFWAFISTGTSFIWKSDASYNLKTMIYVSNYFKDFFKNLLINHQIILPQFDFTLWEGYDIIHALHFPSFGDPFCFLSFMIPENYLYIYYEIIVILKLYIAGIGFIRLLNYKGYNNNYALLSGSFTYVFCYFSLLNAARHLCFLTPIMIMPFLILGLEYIYDKKKPYLYIVCIFWMGISNIFFFYHIVILVFAYVIIKTIYLYKTDIKKIFQIIFLVGLFSVIGLLMASFIFVPIFKVLLMDNRLNISNYIEILYPIGYYKFLVTNFFTYGGRAWTSLGFSAPCFLSLIMLFKDFKANKLIIAFFCLLAVFVSFPIFGKIFNGMAYVINRWTWIFALLIGYIVTSTFNEIIVLSKKGYYLITFLIILYIFIYIYLDGRRVDVLLQTCIMLISVILLSLNNNYFNKLFTLFLCFIVSIIVLSYFFYSPRYNNYIKECYLQSEVNDYMLNDIGNDLKDYKDEIGDKDYFRFAPTYKKDKMNNYIAKTSSTEHYYAISNVIATNFLKKNGVAITKNFDWNEYDNRTILHTLASVKYFMAKNERTLPFGYTRVKKFDSYSLYENNYSLPLLYSYDNVMDDEESQKFNLPTRQEIAIKEAIVRDYKGNLSAIAYNDIIKEVPYTIKGVTKSLDIFNDYIVTYDKNQRIKFSFSGLKNSETYCLLQNINFESLTKIDFYKNKEYKHNDRIYDIDQSNRYSVDNYNLLTDIEKKELHREKVNLGWGASSSVLQFNISDGYSKKIAVRNNKDAYYGGLNDLMINLGYNNKQIKSFELILPAVGIYTFDAVKIYCDDLKNYKRDIDKLKSGKISNIVVGNDEVLANVDFDTNKYVCAGIPYSDGWKAYVDDQETPVYLTNYYHLGIDVPKGKHSIKFEYNNIYIFYGRTLTIIGFIVFVIIVVCDKKHKLFYRHMNVQ